MSNNLPVQLTRFIGREREMAVTLRLLAGTRILTVTGPGGCGKTRLAVQVASSVGDTFSDGAHFISLATITDPTLIIPTIAQALNLAESPDQLLLDSLKAFLHERQMLLLLDNFEQVISAAPLLTELLVAAGELKLLVTSREALRLRGEQVFPLSPLDLFRGELNPEHPDVQGLWQTPSIALFVVRAQANQPDFQLTEDNAAAVAEICARLDGLPLALELAAARIKLLPPQALLERLRESPLQWLSSGTRDAPARHQTLRSAIQWSYDLLNPAEQCLFRLLSVFVGGCTLDALLAICGDPFSTAVIDDVSSLVDKSLVNQSESAGEPRLSLLETLREFGLEQWAQEKELEAAQRDHAQYYLALAEETAPHLTGREQKAWLHRLAPEQDNFRAALRWGLALHEAGFVLRLAAALWQFWFLRGLWSEGRRWLEEALTLASDAEVDKALRAKVLYAAARLVRHQYDLERARALCEQSIALYRALGDKEGLLAALHQLGRTLAFQGDYEPLRGQLPEMLVLAEALPDVLVKAEVYAELSIIGAGKVNIAMAARYLAESERIYRALNNPAGRASTLMAQGQLAALQGDMVRAQAMLGEGERLAAKADDHNLKLHILFARPVLAWLSGDDALARRLYEQLILALREMNDTTKLSSVLGSLALLPAVLHRQGLSVWAARVCGLTDKWIHTSQPLTMSGELFDPLKTRAAAARSEVRARLGDEAFADALAEGQTMTIEDLLAIPHPSPASIPPAPGTLRYEPLTPRELDVLPLLAQGLSNPQIAERLVISRRTVEAHLRSIYGKSAVKSRDAAIRYAIEHGLVEK